MEIKCKVCGTVNDGETNFCKVCFQKLDLEKTSNNDLKPILSDLDNNLNELKPIAEDSPMVDNTLKKIDEDNLTIKPIEENGNQKSLNEERAKQEISEINSEIIPIEENNQVKYNDIAPIEGDNEIERVEEKPNELESDNLVMQPIEETNNDNLDSSEANLNYKQDSEIIENDEIDELVKDFNEVEEIEKHDPLEETIHSKKIEEDEELEYTKEIEKVKRISRTRSKECKEVDSTLKMIFKFIITFIVLAGIGYLLTTGIYILIAYLFKINALENSLLNYIINVSINILVIIFTAILTFRKTIPNKNNERKIVRITYFIVIILWSVISILNNIYNLKDYYLASSLLSIVFALIYGQILYNITIYIIRKKANYEVKKSRGNNLIMFLSIILLVLASIYSIQNKIVIDFFKEQTKEHISLTDEEYVYAFIDTAEKNILENSMNNSDYQIPDLITDISSVGYYGQYPEEIELHIDSKGHVISGIITYNTIRYEYDGVNLIKK